MALWMNCLILILIKSLFSFIFSTLLNEIGELDKSRKTQESLGTDKKTGVESLGVEDYKKTSLAPYMKVFEDFVKNLEKQKKKSDEKAKKSPLDF